MCKPTNNSNFTGQCYQYWRITVLPKHGDTLAANDTEIVITVNGKTVKQAITVNKKTIVTPPVIEKPILISTGTGHRPILSIWLALGR